MLHHIFFDSHGCPWWTCEPTEPGSVAFGPTGAARPVVDPQGRLHFSEVRHRTHEMDGWIWLDRAGTSFGWPSFDDRFCTIYTYWSNTN